MKCLSFSVGTLLWCVLFYLVGCQKTESSSSKGDWIAEIDGVLFEATGLGWIGESAELLGLRDVHLDGASLLNRDVNVTGEVEMIGKLGTFVVISEDQVRMLIDFTHVAGGFSQTQYRVGSNIQVRGKVQADPRGHIFLIANGVRKM